jgi:hypothetical protein
VKFLVLAAVLLTGGCAAGGGPVAGHVSPAPSPTQVVAASESPDPSAASPAPSATPFQAAPPPRVSCVQGRVPGVQAMVTGTVDTILYDVTDPLSPRAVCHIANTVVHIFTGTSFEYLVPNSDGTTSVMLHALGSNNESVAATLRADLYHVSYGWTGGVAWVPGIDQLAYLAGGGADAEGLGVTDVWLATPTGRTRISSYSVAGKDTFGRPGFSPITLDFSPDGAYLAAGWYVARSGPVRVFRTGDRADVSPRMPADFRFAFWAKTGLTLYLVTGGGVSEWTPGGAVTPLAGTAAWILGPSLSPDGGQVAFTIVTSTRDVRAYTYDFRTASSRLLVDQPRSSAMFVKSGWVWEVEERPCVAASGAVCMDPTAPDGKVLAVDLSTGHESPVTFAAAEAPTTYGLLPGDLWPKT